jgi:hypothetical protein
MMWKLRDLESRNDVKGGASNGGSFPATVTQPRILIVEDHDLLVDFNSSSPI